jgi:hypothetical protein
MAFCYAKNWDTTRVPDFKSDIVFATQAVLPILTMRKYSGILVKMMRYIPIWFGKNYGSVVTRSLFSLREVRNRPEARVVINAFRSLQPQMYMNQIDEILRNPGSLENTPHKIIYHSLLDPDANKGRPLPSRLSLRQEAGALLNAGSDSTSISATTITYHVLHNPKVQQRLVKELRTAWPVLEEVPRYEVLEKLPYLASPYNRRPFSSNPKQLFADCGYQRGAPHVSRRLHFTACCAPRRCDDSWNVHPWRSKSLGISSSQFHCNAHPIVDCCWPVYPLCTPFTCGVLRPGCVHPRPLVRRRRKDT